VKLLVDNQLPVALARHLTSLGRDCQHVEALHLDAASDAEIWEYASQRGSVVVSKDEDFLYLASRGGRIEVAQKMAGNSNAKTTGLYDRRNDDVSVGEVERIGI
jgi:predicted nuclease of predicted toxin-antitoxin system